MKYKIAVYPFKDDSAHFETTKKWMANRISNLLIRKADCIIMLCHAAGQFLSEKRNGEQYPQKALYVPHPEYSNVYVFNPNINFRGSLGIRDDAFVVSTFGLIKPYKIIRMINGIKENASVERLKEKYNKLYDILFEGQGR